MVETEDGEDFIFDIVQEIVGSTMAVLHERYILCQTLPYTVQETRKLLLDIIEVCIKKNIWYTTILYDKGPFRIYIVREEAMLIDINKFH
jgi:hypothetical protein